MKIYRRKGYFGIWFGWKFQFDIRWERGNRVTFYMNLNN